jgi:osmotically-inducible protein OsmY
MEHDPHPGTGPKSHGRSDVHVHEHVCDALTDDPVLRAAAIDVEVRDGEVTLSGDVDSWETKRHAQDLALQATGVKDVQNNLRVVKQD